MNAFLDLVLIELEKNPYALQKKAIEKATSKMVKKTVSWMQPSLTFRILTSISTGSSLYSKSAKK